MPETMPSSGVTVSSWPRRAKVAARPSTSTAETVKPRRSRSNAERSCVAVAVTVTSPRRRFAAGV